MDGSVHGPFNGILEMKSQSAEEYFPDPDTESHPFQWLHPVSHFPQGIAQWGGGELFWMVGDQKVFCGHYFRRMTLQGPLPRPFAEKRLQHQKCSPPAGHPVQLHPYPQTLCQNPLQLQNQRANRNEGILRLPMPDPFLDVLHIHFWTLHGLGPTVVPLLLRFNSSARHVQFPGLPYYLFSVK